LAAIDALGDGWLAWGAVIPGLVAFALAVVEGSRATSATAALSTAVGLGFGIATANHHAVPATIALVAATGAVVALTIGGRLLPVRAVQLQVAAPSIAAFALVDVWAMDTLLPWVWRPLGLDPWVESWLLQLGFGGIACLAGVIGRSGWALVPGLGAIAFATVGIASTLASWIGGAAALAAVSVAFVAGAAGLWVIRLRDAGRADQR
ncbi:MAG: hypothetical protein ABMB14_23090, partial [Myxococcota bacterium]